MNRFFSVVRREKLLTALNLQHFFSVRFHPLLLCCLLFLLFDFTPLQAEMWTAELQITVLSPKVPRILFSGKFYKSGHRVRFEPTGTDEIDLFDFKRSVSLRIFPSDRIYFEKPLTHARILKAVTEGWTPSPTSYGEERILLQKGKLRGKQARLSLIILNFKEKKTYSLLWETEGTPPLPLKVIYPSSGYETIIIDYHGIKIKEVNPERFQPPSDFLNLNPF